MPVFLFIIITILLVLLLIASSFRPAHSQYSLFELERRVSNGDKPAKKDHSREEFLVCIVSLQRITVLVFLASFAFLSVVAFGWVVGVIVTILVAVFYGSIAKTGFLRGMSQKIYIKFESSIIKFVKKHKKVLWFFINTTDSELDYRSAIGSREELQHLIDSASDILTADEKSLLVNGLEFNNKTIDSVMTGRDQISFVKKSEFLGPLVLNDLHKTGHSRLPVIGSDLDHVVGVLHLDGLLALDIKRSSTAEKAMEQRVFYIRKDQSLTEALVAFLITDHQLFIVVNKSRETVGLVTIKDVIEALIGRKINSDFDSYDNLRSVVSHKPTSLTQR